MSVAIIIPARYASTRYPGKPLARLTGATGVAMSLIERSWRAATAVSGADHVYVATDDARISAAAEAFGAEVVMTSEACANGTERCADALDRLGLSVDIVVNLQGDAPLTPHWFVEDLVQAMRDDPSIDVATPVLRCSPSMAADLRADRAAGRVGGTTAVFAANGDALYFSKEVIPFEPNQDPDRALTDVYHHVGVYAYRPHALNLYRNAPEGRLERLEGLEQLRFMEHGVRVRCVEVEARGREFWELNNPEDISVIERMMSEMQIV